MADTPDDEVIFNLRRRNHDVDENDNNGNEEEYLDANENHGRDGGGENMDHYGGRRAKNGLPMKPDTFDGTRDWEEYLSHFELCAELGRWPEREKMLALAASLRGPARTFYISLSSREKSTYDDLALQLGYRFGSTRQQNRWLSRLESRTRQTGESIAALGDDLRQMSQKAYPNLDCVAQEALAVNQLYKSISLEMKCRCIDRNCTTVAQAVDIVERYEAVLGDTGDRRKTTRMVSSSHEEGIAEALTKLNARLENLETQLNRRPPFIRRGPPQYQGPRACYICRGTDHLMKDCPNNQGAPSNAARGRSTSRQQGNFQPSSQ